VPRMAKLAAFASENGWMPFENEAEILYLLSIMYYVLSCPFVLSRI
jgi:hypothetical protein